MHYQPHAHSSPGLEWCSCYTQSKLPEVIHLKSNFSNIHQSSPLSSKLILFKSLTNQHFFLKSRYMSNPPQPPSLNHFDNISGSAPTNNCHLSLILPHVGLNTLCTQNLIQILVMKIYKSTALPLMAQMTAVWPSSSSSIIVVSTSCGTFTALRRIHSRLPINTSYWSASVACFVSMLSNCCNSISCFSCERSRLWTISTGTSFTLKFPKLTFLYDTQNEKKCQNSITNARELN